MSRMSLRRGVYETVYGNAAVVNGPSAKSAFDLDAGTRIPISEVTDKYLRAVTMADREQIYYQGQGR